MPHGFLGTRADLIVDTVLVLNVLAPFWAAWAASLARRGRMRAHWRAQLALWALLFLCVMVLEGHIRFSGGSGSLVQGSPYQGTTLLKVVFLSHILPAVATYGLWAVLVFKSFRRRMEPRLGTYSRRHKLLGKVVIAGLIWTAASALVVYALGFAAGS